MVALRKESVDRNKMPVPACIYSYVALRKESVDRNSVAVDRLVYIRRRSPQGERG